VERVTRFSDSRLEQLYCGEGFGGETTMRAKVIRELIDEFRAMRVELAEARRCCQERQQPPDP
jgi:hypothetical protein